MSYYLNFHLPHASRSQESGMDDGYTVELSPCWVK